MSPEEAKEVGARLRPIVQSLSPPVVAVVIENQHPDFSDIDVGSGFLVCEAGRAFIVSAGHVVGRNKKTVNEVMFSFSRRIHQAGMTKPYAPRAVRAQWRWRADYGNAADKDPDVGYFELAPDDAAFWAHVERPYRFDDFDRPRGVALRQGAALILGYPTQTVRRKREGASVELQLEPLAAQIEGGVDHVDEEGIHLKYEVGSKSYDLTGRSTRTVPTFGMSGGPFVVYDLDTDRFRVLGIVRARTDASVLCEPMRALLELFVKHETGAVRDAALAALAGLDR